MKPVRAFAPTLLLALGLAIPAAAQVPTPGGATDTTSRKTLQDSAQKTLILSDAIAARELRNEEQRSLELATVGVQRADNSEIRDFAMALQKQHQKRILDLDQIIAKLTRDNPDAGLGAGVGASDSGGFVAFYWQDTVSVFRQAGGAYTRDTVAIYRREDSREAAMHHAHEAIEDREHRFIRDTMPAFRQDSQGSYSPDTVAVYRLTTIQVVPVPERVRAVVADSAQVIRQHTEALQSLGGMSGKDFDRAFLDRVFAVGEWRRDQLRNNILPVLNNQDLKEVTNDIQTEVGVEVRKAQDLKTRTH